MAGRADPVFLAHLTDMGFPENRAFKALVLSHNTGVEPALAWLVEHGEDADIDEPLPSQPPQQQEGQQAGGQPAVGVVSDPVLGIPSGGPGGDLPHTSAAPPLVVHPGGEESRATAVSAETKMVLVVAAELGMGAGKAAAQAAHGALGLYRVLQLNAVPWLPAWEETGEKTVVLSAATSRELEELQSRAYAHALPCYLVADEGRTQVAPGSITCLGIAGVSETVDRVTGHLRPLP